jgi:hypothetical protein
MRAWLNAPILVAMTASLACAACNRTPEPQGEATERKANPVPSAPAAPTTSASAKASDVTWETPEGWLRVDNPNPMRKATYRLPRAQGETEDADLAISQAGGTVEANVKRWADQFEKRTQTRRTERKVGALDVTVVELSGTFTGGGMPGMAPAAPKPGWSMIAAVVETAPTLTFFKLTGPRASVEAGRAGFEKLLGSLRAK